MSFYFQDILLELIYVTVKNEVYIWLAIGNLKIINKSSHRELTLFTLTLPHTQILQAHLYT